MLVKFSFRRMKLRGLLVCFGCYVIAASAACALDDAEILSRRVPGQSYHVLQADICALHCGNATWGIPIWACDPTTLNIIRILGASAPAPFAIQITTRPNDPMEEISSGRRLSTIHLLAASKEDAIRMRRALIKEIEVMQRNIERRQGKLPGYLKSAVRSQKQ
jgi:hypothetical protein